MNSFTAISMGTDVLVESRNKNTHLREIWKKNADFLVKEKISHSITYYFDGVMSIFDQVQEFAEKLSPTHIMILLNKLNNVKEKQLAVEEKIQRLNKNLPVVFSVV